MTQKQLLLVIFGVITVGLAIAFGISMSEKGNNSTTPTSNEIRVSWNFNIQTITYDGCEYVVTKASAPDFTSTYSITHKGNCKNHVNPH